MPLFFRINEVSINIEIGILTNLNVVTNLGFLPHLSFDQISKVYEEC